MRPRNLNAACWVAVGVILVLLVISILAGGCSAAKVRNQYDKSGPSYDSTGAGYHKTTTMVITPPATPRSAAVLVVVAPAAGAAKPVKPAAKTQTFIVTRTDQTSYHVTVVEKKP